jgi:hypothetical protein
MRVFSLMILVRYSLLPNNYTTTLKKPSLQAEAGMKIIHKQDKARERAFKWWTPHPNTNGPGLNQHEPWPVLLGSNFTAPEE